MATDEIQISSDRTDGARVSGGAENDGLLVSGQSDVSPVLSIVIPTKNEEAAIADCIELCKESILEVGLPTEIIVSDSSTDRTPEIARELGANVVSPTRPGYGNAYLFGFQHVRGEYVAIGDADMTYDFAELPTLLEPVLEGEADMVLGNRLAGEIEQGAMPFLHQYIGNPGLTWILNRLYGGDIGDAHSGFRVMKTEALRSLDLTTGGMEFASEMLIKAKARNLNITEIPISYRQRTGDATLETFRDGWRHIRYMLLNAPVYMLSIPGFALLVLGIIGMAASYFEVSSPGAMMGMHSMIVSGFLIIVGYQAVLFGVCTAVTDAAIRPPDDFITRSFSRHLSLERGFAIGIALFGVGTVYVATQTLGWIGPGLFQPLLIMNNIVGITVAILGLQTVFSAILLSTFSQEAHCSLRE